MRCREEQRGEERGREENRTEQEGTAHQYLAYKRIRMAEPRLNHQISGYCAMNTSREIQIPTRETRDASCDQVSSAIKYVASK